MKKIFNLSRIKNLSVSIGVFDSVHLGHQKILKKAVEEAVKHNTKSLAITFHPHPRKILDHKAKVPFITSLEHRLRLIEEAGVDYFLVIKFTKSLSRMEPDDFIDKVFARMLDIRALVVGRNFLFGNKGSGNFSLLQKASRKYGFELFGVKPVKIGGKTISSTRIRLMIEKGGLKDASAMLGRPVTVFGTVVKGRNVGRKIGFPTANIDPHHEAIPPSGVYSVDVRLRNKFYKGVLNIGRRPTFTGAHRANIEPTIELHILNFKKDIYGKDVEIMFKRKMRNEKRFSSIAALRAQIQKDIQRALNSHPIFSKPYRPNPTI